MLTVEHLRMSLDLIDSILEKMESNLSRELILAERNRLLFADIVKMSRQNIKLMNELRDDTLARIESAGNA